MLDITFYKKQNNDNFVPCTIELCDEDYEKLIVLNFAKRFHFEKQRLIVEEEEYSIDAVPVSYTHLTLPTNREV